MSNDLIRREVLQDRFDNLCPHIECKKCRWYSIVDSFHKCVLIDNAPTVDTYTKDDLTREYLKGYNDCKDVNGRSTGEWKHNNFDEHSCNKCGHPALWSEEADGYYEVQSNFCPNCGADMRKGGAE